MPGQPSIADLHRHFLACNGTSTDTRTINPDSMFFALKGPNFDANTFAAEALAKGARCAVVDDPDVALDDRYLVVPDVLGALQQLATHHRRQFDLPVIGITGSNGKTTTKELVHAVLAADRSTLATSGNLNNHIGVPLTLLRLDPEHRVAIIEMGANKPGDIAELSGIAEPTYGLITNIGKAHLEGFGSYEGVIATKTELYADIGTRQGVLFVNADDELLMRKSEGQRRVTYGRSAGADTSGTVNGSGPFLEVVFVGGDERAYHVVTKLIGAYNLPNVLAAVAVGQHFGVPDDVIAEALSTYSPSNNRSQFTDTGRNQLVLDAYNANPTSMAAALENFAAMRSDRPKLAILGDMLELGADSAKEHRAIVDLVARLKLDVWFVGGEFMKVTPEAVRSAADLNERFTTAPVNARLILVKGSRGIKLETLVPLL
ncbi:MAG TPA: UDP-N-acetylmuramoyl-tripeptide--D-alanyl-D-alanine ligase [Flavobacteriales bacterium]|nr:UDP-N-acetylmuramoyl-tripeptide--D-alanyl-D-alanine ligase [Flavobacteriales bacterium]HNU55236.1 UDP-N-acetylmuramoyl-tripeptide--D-alanyl-D-alanine ligase [Flavobacteriales bacterium]